jgi:hypothetical protein
MNPGASPSCGEYPAGQVVVMPFSWQAREGNTVDILYAYTDGDYRATGGYTLLVSGGAAIGSVGIPIPCPDGPGPGLYLTIKAVAMNPNGSSTAYYWGL